MTVATAPPVETLSTAEVARELHVSPRTVRSLADRGDLPAFRLTARSPRRFRRDDVEALLERARGAA